MVSDFMIGKFKSLFFLIVVGLFLPLTAASQRPADSPNSDRAKAIAFAEANRYLDAYPILEKIAPQLPNDVEVWTHYGISLATRSVTLSDPRERKAERKRAYVALVKAKELGTQHVMALSFLDQLPADGGDEDNFLSENPEVEKALREGEQYFGRGEYDKALAAYERAYKLDPKSYEAVPFMRDSIYAQEKYAQSEPWFAKAAEIDPNRELAYRFWGDALLAQEKVGPAATKFIEAFIADPYARYSWENINKITKKSGKQFDVRGIFPPGTDGFGGIKIDTTQLSEKDGTKLWLKYVETRNAWAKEIFRKENPGVPYRHSLKEEIAALSAVAGAAAPLIKNKSLTNPHHSIVNLLELRDNGMLEPYVLLLSADEEIAEDYATYRSQNRDRLRRFLTDNVFVFTDGGRPK